MNLGFTILISLLSLSLSAQTVTRSDLNEAIKELSEANLEAPEARKVETVRIIPTEVELEYYNSLPRFFRPPANSEGGIVKPIIPKTDSYEKFIEEGLEYKNLEKFLGGDFEGNGGHPALARIKKHKEELAEALELDEFLNHPNPEYGKSDLYEEVMPFIRVICSPVPLRANGGIVIAKNFPHPVNPTIYFDCDQFMNFEEQDQRLLVFHEVLPVIGILDSGYEHSSNLMKYLPNLNQLGDMKNE